MAGRTYRYYDGDVLYPFGFGLSYTHFTCRKLQVTPAAVMAGESVTVSAEVGNVGKRAGDEVVQLYVQYPAGSQAAPRLALQGFIRIHLAPGEKQVVTFSLRAEQLSLVDAGGQQRTHPGVYRIWVGGAQPDLKACRQAGNVAGASFSLVS
jgi:beta-glucosidase